MDSSTEDASMSSASRTYSSIDSDQNEKPFMNEYDKYFRDLLRLYLRHNLTWVAFVDIIKMINRHPDTTYKFPESQYSILKKIDQEYAPIEFGECKKCNSVSEIGHDENPNCPTCSRLLSRENVIMYIPVKPQIEAQLKKHSAHVYAQSTQTDGILRDITDSEIFMQMGDNKLSLAMNTDGVQIYNSGSASLWPIYLVQNYLPPEIRYKRENIILVALHYGEKPSMDRYMLPIISEMQELHKSGICVKIDGNMRNLKPCIALCVLDLPAKHALTHMKSYNGRFGCGICESEGELVGRVIRFTENGTNGPIRTAEQTLIYMQSPAVIKGVQSMSPMVGVPEFDIIRGFGMDYMHSVCLGIVKKIISIWTDSKNSNEDYYLSEQKLNAVNQHISKIKLCSFFTRKPRSITEFSTFKANEARTFLLYLFYPTFKFLKILPSKYVFHMQLLSSAIYKLLGTNITYQTLTEVENDLRYFVNKYEMWYSKSNVVMNLHLLAHICWAVRNNGPLWAQSAFSYETMNGVLSNYVNGPAKPAHQILSKYMISRFLNNDSEEYPSDSTFHKMMRPDYHFQSDEDGVLRSYNVDPSKTSVFCRCKGDIHTYTSEIYGNVSFVDYFVRLLSENTEQIGKIRLFFSVQEHNYFIFENYTVLEQKNQFEFVMSTRKLSIHSISDITMKYVYVKLESNISLQEVIVQIPNHYEPN